MANVWHRMEDSGTEAAQVRVAVQLEFGEREMVGGGREGGEQVGAEVKVDQLPPAVNPVQLELSKTTTNKHNNCSRVIINYNLHEYQNRLQYNYI